MIFRSRIIAGSGQLTCMHFELQVAIMNFLWLVDWSENCCKASQGAVFVSWLWPSGTGQVKIPIGPILRTLRCLSDCEQLIREATGIFLENCTILTADLGRIAIHGRAENVRLFSKNARDFQEPAHEISQWTCRSVRITKTCSSIFIIHDLWLSQRGILFSFLTQIRIAFLVLVLDPERVSSDFNANTYYKSLYAANGPPGKPDADG